MLDNIDMGILNLKHSSLPRIELFNVEQMRRMISMCKTKINGQPSFTTPMVIFRVLHCNIFIVKLWTHCLHLHILNRHYQLLTWRCRCGTEHSCATQGAILSLKCPVWKGLAPLFHDRTRRLQISGAHCLLTPERRIDLETLDVRARQKLHSMSIRQHMCPHPMSSQHIYTATIRTRYVLDQKCYAADVCCVLRF